MSCDTTTEAAISFQFPGPIAVGSGTVIPAASIDPELLGNRFKTLSVINDSDKDIQILYATSLGNTGSFIVPRSIRGFTKTLRVGLFDVNTIVAVSMSGQATGITTFNFSS